jgi:cell division protein FtsZ
MREIMKELLKFLTKTNFVSDKDKELAKKNRLTNKENLKIKVIGVGGTGSNIIDFLYNQGFKHAELVSCVSDSGHFNNTNADKKIQIGKKLVKGLGCAGDPKLGLKAVKESKSLIKEIIKDTDLLILCAGFGGGTGTGAFPYIAQLAKKAGILVIGIVTMPFQIEKKRIQKAKLGLEQLTKSTNTTILIDNNNIIESAKNMKVFDSFKLTNNIISLVIKNIVNSINSPDLVNLGFEDLKIVFGNGRFATISINLINKGKEIKQLDNFILYDIEPKAVYNNWSAISGDSNMNIDEMINITKLISSSLQDDTRLLWTASINDELKGKILLVSYLTGIEVINIKDENISDKLLEDQVTWFDEMSDSLDYVIDDVKGRAKMLRKFKDKKLINKDGEINIENYSKEELELVDKLMRNGDIYKPRLGYIKRMP